MQINFRRMLLAFLLTIALAYPLSALATQAATDVGAEGLPLIFTLPYVGIWLFAFGGGVCASFIYIEEIDRFFKKSPALAKIVIGTLSGVAISSLIDSLTDTPIGAITSFSFFASSLSAPILAGLMAYVGNQKRQEGIYDIAKDAMTNRFKRKTYRGVDNDESS